jgi:hypothetical protein
MAVKDEGIKGKPLVRLCPELRSQVRKLASEEGFSRTTMLEKIVRVGIAVYFAKEEFTPPAELEISAN